MLRTSPIRNYEDDKYQFSTKTTEVQKKLKLNSKKDAVDVPSTTKNGAQPKHFNN